MHLQMNNVTPVVSSMAVTPSYKIMDSPYNQPAQPSIDQLIFQALPTGLYKEYRELDGKASESSNSTIRTPPSTPTPHSLSKRQVILEVELVTVVYLVPKIQINWPTASPVAVTVTVPPPTITNAQWPVINPGSASACWSDMACNSVCPNFQQNGWYAHCIDQACSQCRCQIISQNMCYGQAWNNATWVSSAPTKIIQMNPAVATVTVMAAHAGSSLFDQINRGARWKTLSILILCLTTWLAY